jgi:O-antigen/teichoic acid export membrane protein
MIASGISNIVIRIGSVGLLLLLNIQLARGLGPESYGVLAFTLAWVQLLALFVQFGLPTALTRSVTLAVERGETGRLQSEMLSSLTLMVVIWTVIVALSLSFWAIAGAPRGGMALALPALVMVLILSFGPVIGAFLRGLGSMVTSQLPEQIARPGLFCAALAVALLMGYALSPATALWMQAATAGIAVLLGGALLLQSLPPAQSPAPIQPIQLARGATPFLILSLVQGLSLHAVILVMGQLTSDAEIAHFRVAMQISDALNLFLLGISIVIGPMITQYHDRKDWAELQHTVVWAHRSGFMLLLAPVIVLVIWAEPILILIFGQDYAPAYQAMQILLIGKLAYALIGFSGLVLAMMGDTRGATKATLLGMFLSIALLLVLVPFAGSSGAGLAYVIGSIIINILALARLRKSIGLKLSGFAVVSTNMNASLKTIMKYKKGLL